MSPHRHYGRRAGENTRPPAPAAATTGATTSATQSLEDEGGELDRSAPHRRYMMCATRCQTVSELKIYNYLTALYRIFGNRSPSPSHAQIAANVGCSERTVSRATKRLEDAGILEIWRDTPHRRDDGTFTRARTNLYRLKWPPRGVNSLVAPRGHMRHVKASSRAIAPPGATPPAPAGPPPALFELEKEPEPPPVAPEWVRLGITLDEWLARARCSS